MEMGWRCLCFISSIGARMVMDHSSWFDLMYLVQTAA